MKTKMYGRNCTTACLLDYYSCYWNQANSLHPNLNRTSPHLLFLVKERLGTTKLFPNNVASFGRRPVVSMSKFPSCINSINSLP